MGINSNDGKRQEYRQMAKQMGKREYTLLKMQEYGFWPKHLPTPYERQKNESSDDYRKRTMLLKEYNSIVSEISRLYEDKREINDKLRSLAREYDQSWDIDRIRKDVAKQIMQESIQRRAERKKQREAEKLRISDAWRQHKAEQIVFIGKGYSGGLCAKQTDTAKLMQAGLPVIEDDRALAQFLGIEYRELRFLAYHRDVVRVDHYHRYIIPKKKGGQRTIAAPKPLMKKAQQTVLSGILEKIPVSQSAHGFVRGKSVLSGAQEHLAGPALLVNLDLKDFFPSITFARVRGLFQSLGYSGYVASLLAMLCTDCDRMPIEVKGEIRHVKAGERVLPQGSPASPMLTNVLCRHMDKRIQKEAVQHGCSYSRYADDISLSFAQMPEEHAMRKAVHAVMCIVENEGFEINHSKTRYLRSNTRQVVTGIVVNGPQPGVPRDWVRALRAAIHNAAVQKETGTLSHTALHEILGRAAWLQSVNALRYRRIIDAAHALASEPRT